MLCSDCKIREKVTPKRKYCNTCTVKHWRVKHPERIKEIWTKSSHKTRLDGNWIKTLERDNNICQFCLIPNQKVIVTHIEGSDNTLENLITLCTKCFYILKPQAHRSGPKKLTTWSRKYLKCIGCGQVDSRHHTRGVCNRCYEVTRRAYKREKQRDYYIKWKQLKNVT